MYFLVLLFGYVLQFFNRRVLSIIFVTTLTILASLRYGVGIDFFAYEYIFNRLQPNVIDEWRFGIDDHEIGFRMFGSFLKSIGFSYQIYLMTFAIINMFFIYKVAAKYSFNPTLSLLLFFSFYFITWPMSGIRQSIVIAAGLYFLLKYIEEKKGLKIIIASVALSLIHSSALVLIVYYALSKTNFKKSTLIALTMMCIIFSMLPIEPLIMNLTFLSFYSEIFPYLEGSYSINILDFQSLSRIIFLIVVFIFYDYYTQQGEISKKIINLYIFSMMLYFLLQFSELVASRIAIYGKFLDIIIFANVLYLYRSSVNRLIYIYAIFILSSLYLYKEVDAQISNSVSEDNIIAPYPNIFTKEDYNYQSRYIDWLNN